MICFHTVKELRVLLLNANHYIEHNSFIFTESNIFKHCYLISIKAHNEFQVLLIY